MNHNANPSITIYFLWVQSMLCDTQSFADVPFTNEGGEGGVETHSFLEASDGLVQLFGE